MKKRSFTRILLVLSIIATVCFALAACGKDTEFSFGKYGYENTTTESDWRDLEYPETDITLDGEGKESIWSNTVPTVVKNDTGEVSMTTKAHFGEKGVFFLMENNDPWVFYNTDRTVYHNTSMELYVSTTNTVVTKNTVQLRFGVNGYTEQWIGVGTSADYAWTRAYVKCMSRIKIYGELNTADNDGYAIEAYMPYSELGLDSKPEKLYVLTAFCRINNNNGESNRIGWYGGGDINLPATYFPFTEQGYIGGEITDAPIGDNGNYGKTAGWDLTGMLDEEAPSVASNAGGEHRIYYKNLSASKYAVSANVKFDDVVFNNDAYPKAGLIAAQNASGIAMFMLALDGEMKSVVAARRPANGEWNWPGKTGTDESIEVKEGVKMTVVRDGTKFYYFLNDKYIFENENAMFADNDSVAGFIVFNTGATFSAFEVIDDSAEVDEIINSIEREEPPTLKVTVDGDLTDWSEADKANPFVIPAKDGKSVTVYATKDDKGVYIGYDVYHSKHNTTDPDWSKNTNVEFYLGKSGTQYYLSANGTASGNIEDSCKMVTSGEEGNYHTQAEIFVPYSAIPEYNKDSQTVPARFCFKVGGYYGNVWYTGDWWRTDGSNDDRGVLISNSGIVGGSVKTVDGLDTDWQDASWTTSGRSQWTASLEDDGLYFIVKLKGTIAADRAFFADADGTGDKWWLNQNIEIQDSRGLKSAKVVYIDGNAYHTSFVNDAAAKFTAGTDGGEDTLVFEIFIARENFKDVNAKWITAKIGGQLFANSTTEDNSWQTYLNDVVIGAYTVTYKHNNGDADTVGYVKKGSAVGTLPAPTKSGFELDGWYLADGTTKLTAEYVPSENITVTAKWNPVAPTVNWNSGDASATGTAPDATPVWNAEKGKYELTLPQNPYTLSGYNFGKWSVTVQGADGATQYDPAAVVEIASGSTVTVTAEWVEEGAVMRTVTFALGYDDAPAYNESRTVADGGKLTGLPANPTRKGYRFGGWYLADNTTEFTSQTVVGEDMTVTAKWVDLITLDGNIADWSGIHKQNITGTEGAAGKSVDFYGVLTDKGLYLAVDVRYTLHIYGNGDWWKNTNFEFFIANAGDHQHYVYATGDDTFGKNHDYMTIAHTVEKLGENSYHTVLEVFIPTQNLSNWVQNGHIRVGVAWKTNNGKDLFDDINNGNASDGNMDSYWVPKGSWPNNDDKCYVTVDGIYTRGEYNSL